MNVVNKDVFFLFVCSLGNWISFIFSVEQYFLEIVLVNIVETNTWLIEWILCLKDIYKQYYGSPFNLIQFNKLI